MYVFIDTHTYTDVCTYIYIYTYICICMYMIRVCVYVCVWVHALYEYTEAFVCGWRQDTQASEATSLVLLEFVTLLLTLVFLRFAGKIKPHHRLNGTLRIVLRSCRRALTHRESLNTQPCYCTRTHSDEFSVPLAQAAAGLTSGFRHIVSWPLFLSC